MKILLISGHGAGDPGACANGYQEANLTIEMVNGIAPLLRKYATVDIYPVERNAYKDIQNNQWKMGWDYDYIFEDHFNGGGGTGTEIYVTTKETATKVEQAVMAELGTLYKVRGVKVSDFLVIKTAKNKGVSSALLETCFIDSASDVKVYQENKQKIFTAVANGIIAGFKLGATTADATASAATSTTASTTTVSLKVGAKVTLGNWATHYATGQAIPASLKGKSYTIQQVGTGKVLLKELYSWVLNQDIVGATASTTATATTNTASYYNKYTGNKGLADALKSMGIDGTYAYRAKIAKANGVTDYTGTEPQNINLLNSLKQGKLIEA